MSATANGGNWKLYSLASVVMLTIITLIAVFTRVWVLTAIPIGFLFGFFLQKGELCGASGFSEVILMRERRKVFGFWVAIVVSMAGFAIMDLLGWIQLNPKPMFWLNYVVGGILFGSGMVLAGGCISGCLFKAGAGNLNSMVGLLGIPLGIAMVEHGPLHSLHAYIKTFIIKSHDGGPVTLSSLTGLPFWSLAFFFGISTLFLVLFARRSMKKRQNANSTERGFPSALTRSWKPWQAGLAVGLLSILAYMSSAATGRNYPLGVTHGVLHVQLLITDRDATHVWRKKPPQTTPTLNSANMQTTTSPETKAQDGSAPKRKRLSGGWWRLSAVWL